MHSGYHITDQRATASLQSHLPFKDLKPVLNQRPRSRSSAANQSKRLWHKQENRKLRNSGYKLFQRSL